MVADSMDAMTITDFEKQQRGPYLFDWWLGKTQVPTPLGLFSVEFQILDDGDTNPPDDEMLWRAVELKTYAERHGDYLLDIVFAYYLLAAEDDPDWLEFCKVPHGLTRDNIAEYVREDRSLVVSRHLDWDEAYSSAIHIVPLWDEEHALSLAFRGGAIAAANDSLFKLEAGIFRWIED